MTDFMAIYRFKIAFEDYDEVSREIEIKATQTFEDLHRAFHASINYDGNFSSSFYVSDDHWHKGFEITLKETNLKDASKSALMSQAKLCDYIEDPHQKFYYIANFESPVTFYVELIKILMDIDPKKNYPVCVRSINEAPKQFGAVIVPAISNEDLDFLNEEDLDSEDREEVHSMNTEGDDLEEETDQEEETDEVSEFPEEEEDSFE